MKRSHPSTSHSESSTPNIETDPRNIQKAAASIPHNTIVDRFFKTICLFVGFANLGLASPLLGSTLVHLESLFDVTTTTMSLAIPVQSGGYLAGSILCGVLFDRVNHELSFAVANLVMGLGIIVAPFLGGLVTFIAVMCIQAISQGYIDAGTQSYSAKLWVGHRYREPVVHATHALWSLGGTVSPFIIARFLVDLPQQLQQQAESTTDINWSTSFPVENESRYVNSDGRVTSSISFWNITTSFDDSNHLLSKTIDVSATRFAYVTIGSLVLVAGLLYLVAFFRDRSRRDRKTNTQPNSLNRVHSTARDQDEREDHTVESPTTEADKAVTGDDRSMRTDRFAHLIYIAITFVFFCLYPFAETLPIAYMTTFTVKYLNFPIQNASLLMSLFFGFHFAGRVLGIPISVFLRPRTMVIMNLSLTAVSFMLLLVFVNIWPTIIWISAPMAGLSIATTFGTTILWISGRIPVTGVMASISIVGYSLGLIVGPLSVSQLFESSTPMWFVYILVIASVSHVVLFSVFMVYDARCGERVRRAATGQTPDDREIVVNFTNNRKDEA